MIIDYDESILTYIASIRSYFGLSSSYEPNRKFSQFIEERKPQKIFLLLIDGMGSNLLKRKLPEDHFLQKYLMFETTTVFPPTTAAATTSIRSGKAPCENAWLGWMQYYKELQDHVVGFRDQSFYGSKKYEKGIIEKILPVEFTENQLSETGIASRKLFPAFEEDGCENFEEMCHRLIDYSNGGSYRYIYAYWDKYDSYMHEHGPDSAFCNDYLCYLEEQIEKLARHLNEDTLLIVTADHGQVEIRRNYNLYDSGYREYFSRKPAIEARSMAFYIKKGMEEEFEKQFKEEFERDYILLNHDQILKTKLFGNRENHPRFEEFIGDYLAIAKSDLALYYNETESSYPLGQHAGMCEDELMIPVIVYPNTLKK